MRIREKSFDYSRIEIGDRAITLGGNKLIGSH